MRSNVSRRLYLAVPIFIALLLVFSDSKPAAAQDEVRCVQNYRNCNYQAALKSTFWEMWAAGLDCELGLVDCVRRAVIGR